MPCHKKCRLNVFQLEYASDPQEFENEPKIALETGEEGLEIINKIILESKRKTYC
jgi:methylase of polypeptide subunit release factors